MEAVYGTRKMMMTVTTMMIMKGIEKWILIRQKFQNRTLTNMFDVYVDSYWHDIHEPRLLYIYELSCIV